MLPLRISIKSKDYIDKVTIKTEEIYAVMEKGIVLRTSLPDVKMEVVDTKGETLGTGLIVLQGAKLSDAGISYEDIVRISKENVKNIEYIFTIDDLS